MTVHAEAHAVIDNAIGDDLVREVAVAGLAIHARTNVRRVVEAHVGLVREAVHALPRNLDALLRIGRDFLDQRAIGRDLAVADHARLDAGHAGDRPLLHAL